MPWFIGAELGLIKNEAPVGRFDVGISEMDAAELGLIKNEAPQRE